MRPPVRVLAGVVAIVVTTGAVTKLGDVDAPGPEPSGGTSEQHGHGEKRPASRRARARTTTTTETITTRSDAGRTGRDRRSTTTTTTTSTSTTPAPAQAPTTTTTTTSTTAAPATTTTTTQPPDGSRVATLAFSGDTLPHSPLWAQAQRTANGNGYDFRPMLDPLTPIVGSVDLGVCHLETPIAPEGEQFTTAPLYGVPPEIVGALVSAGYDRCSTASNHTADRGTAGIERTVNVLAVAGIEQSGMARTPEEIRPRVFEVNDIRMSHLSYTFSYNGLVLPAGEEWRSALIEPNRIIADAARARELGAEVVIVSLHWGNEGIAEPTSMQLAVADAVTASGQVDLIVGHHAHVLQPIERVNGRWVLYGLGNIISNLPTSARWPASSQDGAVVVMRLTVTRSGDVRFARPVVHPTWVDRDAGWIVRPVLPALADRKLDTGLRAQLTESLSRTEHVVGPYIADH